jgi:hypothetical protein
MTPHQEFDIGLWPTEDGDKPNDSVNTYQVFFPVMAKKDIRPNLITINDIQRTCTTSLALRPMTQLPLYFAG